MNFQSPRPDRSPEAIEQRRKASLQALAMNCHQGYRPDPVQEAAMDRWVAGEISTNEYRAEMAAARKAG